MHERDQRRWLERNAVVVAAALTGFATVLAAAIAYLAITTASVTHERDTVQGQASSLANERAQLVQQVADLKQENEDLHRQLMSGVSNPKEPARDFETRPLKPTLSGGGFSTGLSLDQGFVRRAGVDYDLSY